MTLRPFHDRREAGVALAGRLGRFAGRSDLVVLGLPRGGVPVAFEVARALGAPLDLLVVRRIGVPGHEELALGAIASGGVCAINERVVAALGISEPAVDAMVRAGDAEVTRCERAYRGDRPPPEVTGATVIAVDDGLATGATMRAAVSALRRRRPRLVAVAVPAAAPTAARALGRVADAVVCVITPDPFHSVGEWYDDFSPTDDDEVRSLLNRAGTRVGSA